MIDPFKVPEPSREAVDALRDTKLRSHSFDEVKAMASLVLRVDVPRIVRAEVERALRKRQEDPLGFGIAAYLAARFGAAPVEAEGCGEVDANLICTLPRGHGGCHEAWGSSRCIHKWLAR